MRLFHKHQWEIIKEGECKTYANGDNPKNSLPIYREYVVIQRCPLCGKIKKDIIEI